MSYEKAIYEALTEDQPDVEHPTEQWVAEWVSKLMGSGYGDAPNERAALSQHGY